MIPEQPTKSPTFAKLRSGAWGIRYEGHAEPGQILNVQLKSGKFKPIKLGNMVFDRDGVKLFTIDEGKDEQEETL